MFYSHGIPWSATCIALAQHCVPKLRRLELGFGTDVNSTGREDIRQICPSPDARIVLGCIFCLPMQQDVHMDSPRWKPNSQELQNGVPNLEDRGGHDPFT